MTVNGIDVHSSDSDLEGVFGYVPQDDLLIEELTVFETGVRYQFYHVFAMLAAAMLSQWFHPSRCRWAAHFFLTGIILFSGSLYLMSFAKAKHWEQLTSLGWITPVGGLFLIAGWLMLLVAIGAPTNKISSGKAG